MSVVTSLLAWAKQSGVLAAAEKEAATEVAQAVQLAIAKASQHAPDLSEPIAQAGQSLLTLALAGLATKAK